MTAHDPTTRVGPPALMPLRRLRNALFSVALLAGCLTAVMFTAVAQKALADTVPPAPSGWTTVFGDNFAGASGSAPSSANWFYDIGTGYGTGEIENTTSSTNNVYLDGNGHLVLKAINNGGTWTSARIESTRDDFQAPAGGKLEMTAEIEQPNPANGAGYWPAFWALGSPMRSGGGWPQSGEIDMMEDVSGSNQASQTLHDSAGSSGHALIACPNTASSCQTGYHTYSVIIDRTNTSAETLQFLMDGTVESTITEASVGTSAWQAAIDHGFFIIFDLAMGGNYPDGVCNCTTPTSSTTSGASMSVGYVAVYEQGGNSTPTATATATGQITGLNGQCLANQNVLNTEGNPMVLANCDTDPGEQWSTYTDSTVRVQGGCLDVVSAGTTSGTNVDWYPCNGTNAQNWTVESNGELLNPNSGLCLTGHTGTRLDIETCTDAAAQQWKPPSGTTSGGGGTGGCGTTDVAVGAATTASSLESAAYPASNATDGNTGTRWSSAFSDPQWLEVDLGSVQSVCGVSLDWEAAYATAFQIQVSTDNSTWTSVYSTTTGTGGTQNLTVSGSGRYIRMYGTARATVYGYSLWEFGVFTASSGSGGGCGTTNVALNKTTTASSLESAAYPASNATDGNTGTRWSSAFSDPQWLEVDLGSVQSVCQVTLDWEAAYATAFQIQVSSDNSTWTTVYSTTTGTGGNQTLSVSGSGRYVRMYGTTRATQYGYSLWEFGVYTTTTTSGGGGGTNSCTGQSNQPNFGPNVYIFDPSMSSSSIQSTLDSVFNTQKVNQFGTQRYALLFKPGTYSVEANIGYYTSIQGLGQNPDDVQINGDVTVDSFDGTGNATQNFWRSAENLAITPSAGSDRWAVAQAGPFRRIDVKGGLELYPASYGYASGGYIADTKVSGQVSSVSQQQWYSQDSSFGSWSGSVWNMVFSGVTGAPAQSFPSPPMTTLATTPVSRDVPYLYIDSSGNYNVFLPSLRTNASGPSWANGPTPGTSVPMSQFFVATPSDTAAQINAALASGCNLFFTPGVYNINQTLNVTNPNTVVLGIGMPTLIPVGGVDTMHVADVDGVRIDGLLFDAGTTNSNALLTVGTAGSAVSHAANPISVQDTFFRIGGDIAGQATNSLVVNANNTLVNDIWAWRADHGNSGTVGWTVNTAQHGLVVNGNNVLATGLFVEHYQNYDVQWLGNGGETIFFQNEMPYDPPNQAAWMNGSSDGYAAYEVGPAVTSHQAYGLGSYCYFNVNPAVVADHAFEAPNTPGVQFHDILTVSLGGVGVIEHVINSTGGATPSNTTPVDVTSYP